MTNRTATNFGHSDPSWRVDLALPTISLSPETVGPGDIVYTRRPGGYQKLTAIAGDTWRHVGIIATIGGFPWLIDMGHGGYAARPFTTVLNAYDTIAVQRLIPCGHYCDHRLLNDVVLQMNTPKDFYHFVELGLIGLNSILRLKALRHRRAFQGVERLVRAALADRAGLNGRAVCTTPVARGFSQFCDRHQIHLDVSTTKGVPKPIGVSKDDHRFAMPDDVWRALEGETTSFWVKKDGKTSIVDIDLTTQGEEVPA